MKSLKYLIIILCTVQITGCQNKEVPSDLQTKLDSISAAMVPQHAEALCDLSLVMNKGKNITVRGETNIPEAKDKILELLTRSGYTYIDSITVLPDTSVVKKPWGLVSVSVCNIRTKPAHKAEMATQALMGTPVKILNKKGDWLLVQTPDSYLGWTDDPVEEISDGELDKWKNSDRIIYLKYTGVISDSRGQVVSDIVFGVILQKTGEQKNIYNVLLPDGREGQINKADATDFRSWAASITPDAGKMTEFARSFLGTPYLWGGTSTKGIDCSGFTKTIYYSAGLILTRDASGQYRYGTEINIEHGCDSLAPGDLLYFGRDRDGIVRITHTGMYIGNTEFIHSSRLVRINSFDSTRVNYSKYLLDILQGARRIIGLTPGKGFERISEHNWYF
jgi:hypothetical protein